jgi:hypothetical protein
MIEPDRRIHRTPNEQLWEILIQRMTHQDAVLEEIRSAQAEMKLSQAKLEDKVDAHMKAEEEIKPAILEVIEWVKSFKLLRRLALAVASLLGGAAVAWTWLRNHVHIKL